MGAYVHTKGLSPNATDWNNIDPRFGMAWHPLPKWVMRGGFGLTSVDVRLANVNTDELVTNTASLAQPAGNPTPLFQISKGPGTIVYPALRADGSVPYFGIPANHTATQIDPHLRNPYTMTWNLNLQYEISKDYVLGAIYSGSSSVGLTGSMQINTLPFGYLKNDPVALAAWIPGSSVFTAVSELGQYQLRRQLRPWHPPRRQPDHRETFFRRPEFHGILHVWEIDRWHCIESLFMHLLE